MNGIVIFNYSNWALRYAELAQYVAQPLAQLYFNESALLCDNTASSPITDDSVGGMRDMILGMATAHVAALNSPLGAPSSTLVGRIASAGQGSVNVSTSLEGASAGRAYWEQTKYGLAFWTATARYRTFRYRSAPRRNMDVFSPAIEPMIDPSKIQT